MQRMISILILLFCFVVLPVMPAGAQLFGGNTLVTIDGTNYSKEDFKRWWTMWNTEKDPLPETPDFYIDWLLLHREAQRMELDQDPGFERQTRIFLNSRGLLLLKYEAVDSRIKVTDAMVEERYNRDFTPRWYLQRLVFKVQDAALAAWEKIGAGELDYEKLVALDVENGGPEAKGENWVRPHEIDAGWKQILEETQAGQFIHPEKYERDAVLYFVRERKDRDEEDFSRRKSGIERDLWKEQETTLTLALLRELREKYEVAIDMDRLMALDIMADDSTFSDEPVITTNRDNVSEKQFMAVIRRLQGSRPTMAHAGRDPEEAMQLKNETATNIIAQSITNWESLDRGFEKREPFKWEYEFNYNHRMVMALEQRLFAPAATVTDEDIEKYYQANIVRYTQPAMAKLYIIDETQGPVERFWAEVATGKDFKQVLRNHFEQRVNPQEIPVNHVDPEVRVVVDRLVPGETSQVFTAQGIKVMVHLEERTPERPLPLARVKDSVRSQMRTEKLAQLRQEYLDTLKSRSKIDVKTRQWRSLQKELGGA